MYQFVVLHMKRHIMVFPVFHKSNCLASPFQQFSVGHPDIWILNKILFSAAYVEAKYYEMYIMHLFPFTQCENVPTIGILKTIKNRNTPLRVEDNELIINFFSSGSHCQKNSRHTVLFLTSITFNTRLYVNHARQRQKHLLSMFRFNPGNDVMNTSHVVIFQCKSLCWMV